MVMSNFIFFKIESMFCEPFPENANQYSKYLPSSFIMTALSFNLHLLLDK